MTHPNAGSTLAVTVGLLALTALAPSAASAAGPDWTCRASAAYLEAEPLLGDVRVEPISANGIASVANPDRARCSTQDAGIPDITLPPGPLAPPGQIAVRAAFAKTKITPETGPRSTQSISAQGGVTRSVDINLGPNVIRVEADLVESAAEGACVAGSPVLAGTSRVVGLRINGNSIDVPDDGSEPTVLNLLPLVRIALNDQDRSGTATSSTQSLTRRALDIQVLGLLGRPTIHAVVGESVVGRSGAVCEDTGGATGPTGPGGATGSTGSTG
ncbi:MAG: hypothetical protein H0V81_04915, partial [Solirubrobacterales bacterium]|nr:hypothetical protein [Solirubrobacterales bacterium]